MNPLVVHLYKTHFTISDIENPIKLSTLEFADALNQLLIPSMIPFNEEHYEKGQLVLDVYDHRYMAQEPTRLYLSPTPESIEKDIQRIIELIKIEDKEVVDFVQVESKLLLSINPTLQLDTVRSRITEANPKVAALALAREDEINLKQFQQNLVLNYNRKKYYTVKPSREPTQGVKKGSRQKELVKLLLLLEKGKDLEFYPRFNQATFVEEWRRKKELADQELLIGLGDKNKIKINPMGNATRKLLVYNLNRRIIRTLRFCSTIGGEKIYTMLNVYELPDGMYEAVLRWGSIEGTSTYGDTLKYPLGNKEAVDYYIAHFKGFYGIRHQLQSDSAEQR